MQITETLNQGLLRQYQVTVSAADLEGQVAAQLQELQGKARINGFRPGKVPVGHLRKTYGRSVMADVMQASINDASRKITEEYGLKLARQPDIKMTEEPAEIEAIFNGKADLSFSVHAETLPKFEIANHSDISLEREVSTVTDEQVNENLTKLMEANRPYVAKADGAKIEKGDKATIDFKGTLDGVAFDGGTAEDSDLVIGSGQFIPGFEDQLIGVKAGKEKTVKVTFPADYGAANLAGKAVEFAVKVKAIAAPGTAEPNDEFAKTLGFENIDGIKDVMRKGMQGELDGISRRKVKRKLLDAMDAKYTFDLPASLVEQEFANIWQTLQNDMQQAGRTFEDENTTEEKARAEYRRICERRVRLGLVLAEYGDQKKVEVSEEEMTNGLMERARQFPGQEREIWDFYRKNPNAFAELRAPIFEEKVVDLLLAEVKLTDKQVSREELAKEDEDDVAA